jgi:hypothetical protein
VRPIPTFRVGILSALALVMALAAPVGEAKEEESALTLQQRVKAAFIYKFASYVEWPRATFAEAETPIVIGVADAEAIARELERAVQGRKVGDRPVHVRRLARSEATADCCQILFVGGEGAGRFREMLDHLHGQPVLTVTDVAAGLPKGSVINFLSADDRIRFDISREAAERNGLQLSSQLLSVARRVVAP